MLNFEKITISHKDKIEPFLRADGVFATERNFTCLFIWGGHYNTEVCITDDLCYIRARGHDEPHFSYYPPLGSGDLRLAMQEIAACEGSDTISLFGLTPNQLERFEQCFGDSFTHSESRSSFDYIYTAEALIGLAGRSYSAKRNHINKFMSLYDGRWEYRNINFDTDRGLITAFQERWCVEKEEIRHTGFQHEYCAIMRAIENHKVLGLLGGILFVDGEVAAYTIAAPTSDSVMDILIEKADIAINGSYAVVNNQFATANLGDYRYINREEDLGLEGLRKAKLSYYPEQLIEKHTGQVKL